MVTLMCSRASTPVLLSWFGILSTVCSVRSAGTFRLVRSACWARPYNWVVWYVRDARLHNAVGPFELLSASICLVPNQIILLRVAGQSA